MSRHFFWFLILFLLLSLTGCVSKKEKKDSFNNTLVLSISGDPKSFNPIIAKETSTLSITRFIFEGLTKTDGVTLEVKPCLAKNWSVDSSGKKWRFFLRQDVKWHDGVDFTADDVVFTFNNLVYNPEIPTSSRDVLSIEGKPFKVTKIDRYTVEFELPEKFAPFLRLMGHEILPKHKLFEDTKKGVFNSVWGVNEKPVNIVGTGPFILKDYRPAEWVILDKNPIYWEFNSDNSQRLPYIDRISFFIMADSNMALLKFKAGEIDLISVRGQDYPLLKPIEKASDFKIFELGPSLGSEFLSFNQNSESKIPNFKKDWFRNKNFRRAVAFAIDKESIVRNVYGGFAIPQDGPLNISCGFFYNSDIIKYRYNIEKSKKLLKEEGFFWKNNILFDNKKNPVEFSILTNSNNAERIQLGSIIQNDLEKIGMKINLLPIEFNTLVTKLSVSKDWESVIIGLTGGVEPHSGKNVWHTQGQLHLWNMSSKKRNKWEEKVDTIFEEGAKLLDDKERKKLYDEWQNLVTEELPFIYTASPTSMVAVKNKLGNLKPSVYGGALHNIEEIFIKEGIIK